MRSFVFAFLGLTVSVALVMLSACGGDSPATAAPANDAGPSPSSDAASDSFRPSVSDASDSATDSAAAPSVDVCASSPALPPAVPGKTTTGVPLGTALTTAGGLVVNIAGAIIEGQDVTGQIRVAANDVTIRNCSVHTSGGPNDIGIVVADGVKGTKILHSEIHTDKGGYIGVEASNTFVCATYIHGYENGMTVGGGMVIQANFIERLQSGQPGAHYDGIEIYGGGAPTKVWGNHIRMTDPTDKWLDETGAINLTAYNGDIDDVEMNGNSLGGGSYTLYVDEQNTSKATNVRITNQIFFKGTAAYGTHLIRRDGSVTQFSGNVLDDGTAVEK